MISSEPTEYGSRGSDCADCFDVPRFELAGRERAVDVPQERGRQHVAQARLRAVADGAPADGAAAHSRNRPTSVHNVLDSGPVVASVLRIGGFHSVPLYDLSDRFDATPCTTRSAPSRSALFTTKMSPISMMPALIACRSSPAPGTSRTIEMSAVRDDVHFILADADGLDDHDVVCRRHRGRARHRRSRARDRQDGREWPCCE